MSTPTHRHLVGTVAVARLVSVTGSQAAQTALLVDLFDRTRNTAWVSAAGFATVGVLGLVSPLAGAIADRYDRRTVMISAELVGAVLYLALLVPGTATTTIGLVLLATAMNAPYRAACAALLPTVLPQTELTRANGLLSGAFSTGLLAGPVLGGLLTAAAGPATVYGLNGTTFLISAALLARVLPRSVPESDAGGRPGSVWDGLRHLTAHPKLRLLTLAGVALFLAIGLTVITDLPLAQSFSVGPVGFGLLATCWGAGSVAGSLSCARWSRPGAERAVSTRGALAMAAGLAVVAVLPTFPAVLVGSLVGGVGSSLVFPPWTTLLQTLTPPALRGRVFAASDAVEQAANAVGTLAAAPLLTTIGVRPTYLVIGALAALAALCLYRAATTPNCTTPAVPQPIS